MYGARVRFLSCLILGVTCACPASLEGVPPDAGGDGAADASADEGWDLAPVVDAATLGPTLIVELRDRLDRPVAGHPVAVRLGDLGDVWRGESDGAGEARFLGLSLDGAALLSLTTYEPEGIPVGEAAEVGGVWSEPLFLAGSPEGDDWRVRLVVDDYFARPTVLRGRVRGVSGLPLPQFRLTGGVLSGGAVDTGPDGTAFSVAAVQWTTTLAPWMVVSFTAEDRFVTTAVPWPAGLPSEPQMVDIQLPDAEMTPAEVSFETPRIEEANCAVTVRAAGVGLLGLSRYAPCDGALRTLTWVPLAGTRDGTLFVQGATGEPPRRRTQRGLPDEVFAELPMSPELPSTPRLAGSEFTTAAELAASLSTVEASVVRSLRVRAPLVTLDVRIGSSPGRVPPLPGELRWAQVRELATSDAFFVAVRDTKVFAGPPEAPTHFAFAEDGGRSLLSVDERDARTPRPSPILARHESHRVARRPGPTSVLPGATNGPTGLHAQRAARHGTYL